MVKKRKKKGNSLLVLLLVLVVLIAGYFATVESVQKICKMQSIE